MASSRDTLKELRWGPETPWSPVSFPVLTELDLSTYTWRPELLNILQSIDYPTALPALSCLEINLLPGDDDINAAALNLANNDLVPLDTACPSTTVETLHLYFIQSNLTTFRDLSKMHTEGPPRVSCEFTAITFKLLLWQVTHDVEP